MLEIKDVHKSFGDNEILKGVDVTIDKGDVVVILGPSGNISKVQWHKVNETLHP